MADWPTTDELKRVLNYEGTGGEDDVFETTIARVLASAIARVKSEIGAWDEDTDVPTESQSQAALRMAELIALRPESAAAAVADPTYRRLLYGSRRSFGIS